MTRDIRILPTAALTATTIALVAFVAQHPAAAKWAGVVALVLAVGGLFTLAVENVQAVTESDDKGRRIEALEARCAELTTENAALHALADRAGFPPVDPSPPTLARPELYVIPSQRAGEHDALPAADETWLDEITDGRWI